MKEVDKYKYGEGKPWREMSAEDKVRNTFLENMHNIALGALHGDAEDLSRVSTVMYLQGKKDGREEGIREIAGYWETFTAALKRYEDGASRSQE